MVLCIFLAVGLQVAAVPGAAVRAAGIALRRVPGCASLPKRLAAIEVARVIRKQPGSERMPLVTFGRTWPSALFYLRRESLQLFDRHTDEQLRAYLLQEPRIMILVDDGPMLDELIQALPQG